jgi:aldehyde dehydrogenase (NAD+)
MTHSSIATLNIDALFKAQQANRQAVANTTCAERLVKIRRLRDVVLRHRDDIRAALKADMNAPETETDVVEVYRIISEVRHVERHLSRLMRTQRVPTPLALLGTSSRIQYEPKGVCLIIAPWNFPFDLTINPLIAAVAAGNCVIVKPSEISTHSSAVLRRIIEEAFPANEVAVVEGDVSVATALLALPFNHIFFTGAPAVGKIVMKAAAEHLASVTLELGGKSPAIVDETADIESTARRLMGGKMVKCGQMCISADYVWVHESKKDALLQALRETIEHMQGGPEADISQSTRLISDRHFQRVKGYLDDAVLKGARIETGGRVSAPDRYIAPTILTNVHADMLVMQEEIFGPLLPVMVYRQLDEVVAGIEAMPKPLSMYIFSRSHQNQQFLLQHTSAGGVSINAVGIHAMNNDLPFGGVNNSGIGKSHGAFGFREFSNAKAILRVPTFKMGIDMLFAPYTKQKQKLVDFLIKWL